MIYLAGLAALVVVTVLYLVFFVGKRDPRLPPGLFSSSRLLSVQSCVQVVY